MKTYFNGFNTPASPVNYSGQTIKMNAQTDVIAGKTYHIKLIIADDGEEYYDSAVFLEAGSFSAKMDLGPDRTTQTTTLFALAKIILSTPNYPQVINTNGIKMVQQLQFLEKQNHHLLLLIQELIK